MKNIEEIEREAKEELEELTKLRALLTTLKKVVDFLTDEENLISQISTEDVKKRWASRGHHFGKREEQRWQKSRAEFLAKVVKARVACAAAMQGIEEDVKKYAH